MTEEEREKLRAHWMTRALKATREAYVSTGGGDILFLILQAALLASPLFEEEPYYQVVTPTQRVGAIIDENGYIRTNVYHEGRERLNAARICEARELVDNLGRLADACGFTTDERLQLYTKVRSWITHDDREGPDNMANDRIPGVPTKNHRERRRSR